MSKAEKAIEAIIDFCAKERKKGADASIRDAANPVYRESATTKQLEHGAILARLQNLGYESEVATAIGKYDK